MRERTVGLGGLKQRIVVLLAVVGAILGLSIATTAPRASAQDYYAYCVGTNLAPYGQYGDRCYAWGGGILAIAGVHAIDHSACVDVVDAAGNLMQSWSCTPSGGAWKELWYLNEGIYRRAVVRNNTTGSTNHIDAYYRCYGNC